jgi:hypothetical protein
MLLLVELSGQYQATMTVAKTNDGDVVCLPENHDRRWHMFLSHGAHVNK